MPYDARLQKLLPEIIALRHDLHAHPETAFEENRTAGVVAQALRDMGLEVETGLARTGVVGVLRRGEGPVIGLRADMDALHLEEKSGLPYASKAEGRMHGCGHDGHTAMLLGAARLLAEEDGLSGTVVFIFQPAEENEGGGREMVEDGLFDRYPVDAVYGLHNWPGMPVGQFALKSGPMMASYDVFELDIIGKGAHAAMPDQGNSPIPIAGDVVKAWNDAFPQRDDRVVSVTQVHGGDAWNVIPDTVTLRGTARALLPETQDEVEAGLAELATKVCEAAGAKANFTYTRRYPPTSNCEAETAVAVAAAQTVAGMDNVSLSPKPSLGAEDFAFMLREVPGAYIWMGNGSAEGGRNLHSPNYDFNDEALAVGMRYWVELVRSELGT